MSGYGEFVFTSRPVVMDGRARCVSDHLLCSSLSRLERVSGGELSCACGAEKSARARQRNTLTEDEHKNKMTFVFIGFVVSYLFAVPFRAPFPLL